jgi:phage shock protein C
MAGATPPAQAGTMNTTSQTPPPRPLRRCPHNRMVAGVAAGVAEYLDIDPTAVRLALVILTLMGGLAVPLYAAGWLLIPEEESDRSVAEDLLDRRPAWPAA